MSKSKISKINLKDIRIAFFDSRSYTEEFFNEANKGFGFKLRYYKPRLNIDSAVMAADADVVCGFVNDDFSAPVVDALYSTGIKMIALRCAGFNNVDLKSVFGRIHVARVPAYSPHAIAEHAAALILSLNRKIHRAYYRVLDNNFSIDGLLGFDLHGKTIGVIGTGQIGKVAISIFRGFGMNVLAADPFPDREAADRQGFSYTDLDTIFSRSDIISLHCPLTTETRHLINAQSISRMKPGVMIINTGRGALIDTPALIASLKEKKIGSAGLDVYEEESDYFFEDFSDSFVDDDVLARLMTFKNVIITSHQGFFTREALANIAATTLGNIRDLFEGRELKNQICYRCSEPSSCRKKAGGICF
ncbi:MAG: hydroxyacid dehydrogenase [Candidatus Wallbacteria bacterium HGW-Wallbacteria-1]|jgi:D-lactate dehydrogenase|uniref:Hydroxyacid dehydrogenase n=1 Tax=Candidatus Wallbacteria bacterium HGW-Wallbacteria-1 TaxID=2013854 RepID=A0A2N1PR27_9BACT|nr:MAG: hydroxyacid dehydrogenase [Candidatus Wallbacteria bacterium HGW-Wallbacteria-1]